MPAPRVSFGDWALFGISLMFCGIGVFLLVVSPKDRPTATTCLTFFGVCAFVFAHGIARKYRRRRFNAQLVAAPPGVKLRMSPLRLLFIALLMAIPSLASLVFAPHDWVLVVCAGLFLAMAAGLIAVILSGRVARTFMRFDVAGLTVGQGSFEYLVPWNNIVNVSEFEFTRNECVGIVIADPAALLVTPDSQRARLKKALSNNLALCGCHIVFMTVHFGVDAGPLVAALRRYAMDAGARRELLPKPALQSPP